MNYIKPKSKGNTPFRSIGAKKSLLIVTLAQFGYHIDTYEYAKGLKQEYDITVYCWDYHKPKVEVEGIRVIYASREGNIIQRNLSFRQRLHQLVAQDFDYIFVMYFVGASLIHLFKKQGIAICDIRTGATTDKVWLRTCLDQMLCWESSIFKNRTIISKSLAEKFRIKNYHLLPLGGNAIPFNQKNFDAFHLVYVGEFDNRRIEDTVYGFGEFYHKHKDQIACKYTIIGAGKGDEKATIEAAIQAYQLEAVVELTGYIQHDQLGPYLEKANIGISYVPITPYFDCQPPTKTYEYLLGGMAVLATSTKENSLVINAENGVLIKDTPSEVAKGLETLYQNRNQFNAKSIQEDAEKYRWENIVNDNLKNYLTHL